MGRQFVRRPEQRRDRHAERRRDVHGARVVRHEPAAARQHAGERGQIGPAHHIEDGRARPDAGQDLEARLAIRRAADRANLRDKQDATGGIGPAGDPTKNAPRPAIVALPDAKRQALATKKITIDIMVLYTQRVAAKYVDVNTDLMALSIEQTNESFKNSGARNISRNRRDIQTTG